MADTVTRFVVNRWETKGVEKVRGTIDASGNFHPDGAYAHLYFPKHNVFATRAEANVEVCARACKLKATLVRKLQKLDKLCEELSAHG